MRTIKRILSIIAIATTCQYAIAQADENDSPNLEATKSPGQWSFSLDVIRPGDDAFWDDARGATVKYTTWRKPGQGLALSVGIQNWSVNEEIGSFGQDLGGGVGLGYAAQLAGDAQMIPISALGVFQLEMSPSVNLNIEAGISYVIVNSDVQYLEAAVIGNSRGVFTESYATDVDIDNGIVAVFAADLQYKSKPESKWTFFAGAGGQADVSKGDRFYPFTPLSGTATTENELKGLFVRVGLSSSF